MRIFLSYGHDEYAVLAARLKTDLEARGHDVWFDLDRLRPGAEWESYIEKGLDWTAAVEGAGRFIALMTPHSVRRPTGYCLNELARACARNLTIVPVMAVTVEPPLSICRLQYLDMRDCMPLESREEKFGAKLVQLVTALESNRVESDGMQSRLLNYLDPLPSEPGRSRELSRFTGRHWVLEEIDRWLADQKRRVLWITGKAGVGKSALSASIAARRAEIAAFHACRYGHTDRTDPRKVWSSIAHQLSTQLDSYRDRLNASNLDSLRGERSARSVFERLFVDPLGDRLAEPEHPVVILIDGLDEATQDGRNELASIIGSEWTKTPSWLRLIVTSRPDEDAIDFPLQALALDKWNLRTDEPENLKDIGEYLRRELAPFSANGEPPPATVERIVARSEGLFLYVNWIRQELENGHLSLEAPDRFPQGLGGIYASFFERYFPDPGKYADIYRPVFETICAAREPLPAAHLARMFGWSDYQENEIVRALGSLFPVSDGGIRPFHQSVLDWLTDAKRAGRYFVSIGNGRTRMAESCWKQYQGDSQSMSGYALRHVATHLVEIGNSSRLISIGRDVRFLDAQEARFPDDPRLPLTTLDLALRAAAQGDEAPVMVELLLALAERSARARETSPLEALRAGRPDRAKHLVDLKAGHAPMLWRLLIAEELQDQGRTDQARAVMASLVSRELEPLFQPTWEAMCASTLLAGLCDVDRDHFNILQQRLFPQGSPSLYDDLIARNNLDVAITSAQRFGSQSIYHGLLTKQLHRALKALDLGQADRYLALLPRAAHYGVGVEVVIAHARAGHVAESLQTARTLDPSDKVHALRRLAELRHQQGATAEARELVAEALDAAEEAQDERSSITGCVGLSQAELGDDAGARSTFARARAIANRMDDPQRRDLQYQTLAGTAAQAGEFANADEMARQISDGSVRSVAWEAIMRELASHGKIEAAFALAERAEPDTRMMGIEAIAAVQREKGDVDGALATSHRLEGQRRDTSLSAIVAALADRGDIERAFQIVRTIEDPDPRGRATGVVSCAVGKRGDWPAALTLAREIESDGARTAAIRDLVTLRAQGGDFNDALAIARTIVSAPDHVRELALLRIAAEQWQAGHHDEYRSTLAEALTASQPEPRTNMPERALRDLAVDRARARDWIGAQSVAELIDDPRLQSEAFAGLADRLVEAGALEIGHEISASIANPRVRSRFRSRLAVTADPGSTECAANVPNTNTRMNRDEAIRAVVMVLRQVGKEHAAQAILASGVDTARPESAPVKTGLPTRLAAAAFQLLEYFVAPTPFGTAPARAQPAPSDPWWRTSYLGALGPRWLAKELAESGFADLALKMIESLPAWKQPDSMREAVVSGLVSRGEYSLALNVARSSSWYGYRDNAIRAIVQAQAVKRLFADAFATAEALRAGAVYAYERSLADIAEVQANLDLVSDAEATLARVQSAYDQVRVLARIAVAHSRGGNTRAARATLTAAEEKARSAGGFGAILDAYLEVGDFDAALALAPFLSWQRTGKLTDVAVALIRTGEIDRACEIVENPRGDLGGYLFSVGSVLADISRRDALKRLLPLAAESRDSARAFCLLLARVYTDDGLAIARTIAAARPAVPPRNDVFNSTQDSPYRPGRSRPGTASTRSQP